MKLFNRNKNKNKNKGTGNDIINQLALQEALRELKAEREITESLRKDLKIYEEKDLKNKNIENNLKALQNTNEKIKEICKTSKTSKISKQILKELGE